MALQYWEIACNTAIAKQLPTLLDTAHASFGMTVSHRQCATALLPVLILGFTPPPLPVLILGFTDCSIFGGCSCQWQGVLAVEALGGREASARVGVVWMVQRHDVHLQHFRGHCLAVLDVLHCRAVQRRPVTPCSECSS